MNTQALIDEFLKNGGTTTQCKPRTAKGVTTMKYQGTRGGSSRNRAFRNTGAPKPSLGYAMSGWSTYGK